MSIRQDVRPVLVSSTVVAAALAVARILRPSGTMGPEMVANVRARGDAPQSRW